MYLLIQQYNVTANNEMLAIGLGIVFSNLSHSPCMVEVTLDMRADIYSKYSNNIIRM